MRFAEMTAEERKQSIERDDLRMIADDLRAMEARLEEYPQIVTHRIWAARVEVENLIARVGE